MSCPFCWKLAAVSEPHTVSGDVLLKQIGPHSHLIAAKYCLFYVFIFLVLELQADGCFCHLGLTDFSLKSLFFFFAVFLLMALSHVSWKGTNSWAQSRGKLSVPNNAKWTETIL